MGRKDLPLFQIILCPVSEQKGIKGHTLQKPKPHPSHHFKANKKDKPLPCTPVITAKISPFSMGTPFFLCFLPLALFQLQNTEKLKHCRIIFPNSPTFTLKLSPPALFPSTYPSAPYSSGLPPPLISSTMGFAGFLGFPSFGCIKTNQKTKTCSNNSLKMHITTTRPRAG